MGGAMRNLLLPIIVMGLLTPISGWAQSSQQAPGTGTGSTRSQAAGNIPTTGGSDVSEDAIGGRGAAMEGSGVEGSQGAPGGATDGNPSCPPGAAVDTRCRN
jgi:hypothetical protein